MTRYSSWLEERTSLREIEGCVEITTPYLDRHNDYLQIYVKSSSGGFVLTDDGYVLDDLELSGCGIDSPKRQEALKTTLNGFGVTENQGALEVEATPDDFPVRKHNLAQAMLAVNDLFHLASPVVASLFRDDVTRWLDDFAVRYSPNVKFTGKSGFDHRFDFVVPKSKKRPERVLRVINRPDRNAAQGVAFSWLDTRATRPPEARAYAIVNDSERSISTGVLEALRNYDVTPFLWSSRDDARDDLAA